MKLFSLANRRMATGSLVVASSLALAASAAAAPSVSAHQKVTTVKTSIGRVLSNPAGKVMYLYTEDSKNVSNCTGVCAVYWPPVKSTRAPVAGPHVSAKHLGRTKSGIVTYYGHPLYYYAGDSKPKQMRGQGVDGGEWWVVGTNGKPVKG